jgi:hypothetical protein
MKFKEEEPIFTVLDADGGSYQLHLRDVGKPLLVIMPGPSMETVRSWSYGGLDVQAMLHPKGKFHKLMDKANICLLQGYERSGFLPYNHFMLKNTMSGEKFVHNIFASPMNQIFENTSSEIRSRLRDSSQIICLDGVDAGYIFKLIRELDVLRRYYLLID